MNEDFVNALENAAELYAEYLSVTGQGTLQDEVAMAEPLRTTAYPVGFALDERKVHAVVG